MKHNEFLEKVEANPIIASVKNEQGLSRALESDVEIIFILYGDICSIPDITRRISEAGKISMVHLDLISGLNNSKEASVDFIKQFTSATGVISTKTNIIERAEEVGLRSILRYFVLDSMALGNIEKQARHSGTQPDLIEILPGAIRSKVISHIKSIVKVPVIAGGLISDKEDVMYALNSGVLAISTTDEEVWKL